MDEAFDDFPDNRPHFSVDPNVVYLNHGSFGPSPCVVQQARQHWTGSLEREPMDFFVRRQERELETAYSVLGQFVNASPDDLVFVDNATAGMNIVAENVSLSSDDQVLVTDHEYGAVLRVWRAPARERGRSLVVAQLPNWNSSPNEMAQTFLQQAGSQTRLIVVSHITSPTALILPVAEICRLARERGIPVCIDGPHAVAMVPLDLRELDCDFYTASCHKWLSAPFGTGFLYVRRRYQQGLQPVVMSWGGSLEGRPPSWKDEFHWAGTRDLAGYLAIPAAIEFLQTYGVDKFRQETHALARYARHKIVAVTGCEPAIPDEIDWYGSMIALPLPPRPADAPPKIGHRDPLQNALWNRYRIEAPVTEWRGQRFIRVSCHLYNRPADVERLVDALRELLAVPL